MPDTNTKIVAAFESFMSAAGDAGMIDASQEARNLLTDGDILGIGKMWSDVTNFFIDNNMVKDIKGFDASTPLAKIKDPNIYDNQKELVERVCTNVGRAGFDVLVKDIPEDLRESAKDALGAIFLRDHSYTTLDQFLRNDATARMDTQKDSLYNPSDYMPGYRVPTTDQLVGGLESFGKGTDIVASDLRLVTAITLMRFSHGVMDRIIKRRSIKESTIRFTAVGGEIFEFDKALRTHGEGNDTSTDVYVGQPFNKIYTDPFSVDINTKRIKIDKANDATTVSKQVVLSVDDKKDDFILFNKEANILHLGLKGQPGYDTIDHTDYIVDNATMGSVLATIKKSEGGKPDVYESFLIPYEMAPNAKLNPQNGTGQARKRFAHIEDQMILDKNSVQADGTPTKFFKNVTGNNKFIVKFRLTPELNLATGIAHCGIAVNEIGVINTTGKAVESGLQTAMDMLSFETTTKSGYKLAADYSPNNFKKVSISTRTNRHEIYYKIAPSESVVVDHEVGDTPGEVVGLAGTLTSIANDGESYKRVKHQIENIKEVLDREIANPPADFRNSIQYMYPTGTMIDPYIHIDTFKLKSWLKYDKSGEKDGDIQGAVDSYLREIFIKGHMKTNYKRVLKAGDKPTYRVLTSEKVLSKYLSVNHYHDHLNTKTIVSNKAGVDFVRVLNGGIVLEIVICPWDVLEDAALIVPWKSDATTNNANPINFGFIGDMGMFSASLNISENRGHSKRLVTNCKEGAIITNPYAYYIMWEDDTIEEGSQG